MVIEKNDNNNNNNRRREGEEHSSLTTQLYHAIIVSSRVPVSNEKSFQEYIPFNEKGLGFHPKMETRGLEGYIGMFINTTSSCLGSCIWKDICEMRIIIKIGDVDQGYGKIMVVRT